MNQYILELKAKSKNLRDFEMYAEAIDCITEAIEKLKPIADIEKVDEGISELADCYGILGGLYRRWAFDESLDPTVQSEKFALSFDAYSKGSDYEQQSRFPPSYNALNSLIAQIYCRPAVASEGNFKEELQTVKRIIEQQLNTYRKKDIWALADLFLVRLLLDEYAQQAFKEFYAEAPPQFVFTSLLSNLTPLSRLDTPIQPKLIDAVNVLEKLV